MKRNLAVFFTGRVYDYESNKKYFQLFHSHFSQDFNIYYFASLNSSYSNNNNNNNDISTVYHTEFINYLASLKPIQPQFENFSMDKFNIFDYFNFENFNDKFVGVFKDKYISSKNMCSMFYNNKRNLELINEFSLKNKIHFDVVMKWRSEIIFPIEKDIFKISFIDENTIYIPIGKDWGGINDQVAYGNLESMTYYSKLFNILESYNERIHPETILKYYLLNIPINNVFCKIHRFNYEYDMKWNRVEGLKLDFNMNQIGWDVL